jgi:hypothetical protein
MRGSHPFIVRVADVAAGTASGKWRVNWKVLDGEGLGVA